MDYSQPSKPPGWDRRMKDIHPKLETRWNAPRRRWEIWYDSDKGLGPRLAIVVGDGYNYKPLGEDLLKTLKKGDSHRIGPRAVVEIMEAEEEAYLKARERELSNVTEAASKEMADHTVMHQKPIGVTTEFDLPRYPKPKPGATLYGPDGKRIT